MKDSGRQLNVQVKIDGMKELEELSQELSDTLRHAEQLVEQINNTKVAVDVIRK